MLRLQPMRPPRPSARRIHPICVLLIAGCSAASDGAGSTGPGGSCTGGKCDGFEVPAALAPIALDGVVQCHGVVDHEADPFFAVHELRCTVQPPEALDVHRVYFAVNGADGSPVAGETSAAPESFGSEVTIARFRDDDFPLDVRITVPFLARGGQEDHSYWGFRQTIADRAALAAATAEAPLSVDLPVEIWPIVLWPSEDTVTQWSAGTLGLVLFDTRYAFPVTGSAELAVGGVGPVSNVDQNRYLSVRPTTDPDISVLARQPMNFLVPRGGLATPADLNVQTDVSDRVATPFDAPGYYVLGTDGSLVRTEPAELPPLSLEPIDPTDPLDPDAGVPIEPDAGEPEPDAGPSEPVDPCMGSCTAAQVCVAGACVARGEQDQDLRTSSTCYAPNRACDAGDDGDCAPDHACVLGECRRLACQHQDLRTSTTCYAADEACESDAHCASGHTCVSGLCRRTVCQIQDLRTSTTCYDADEPCARDLDCDSGHACVAEQCRRLVCQNQDLRTSTTCYPADQPCAIDAHCDAGHTCSPDGLCVRTVCS